MILPTSNSQFLAPPLADMGRNCVTRIVAVCNTSEKVDKKNITGVLNLITTCCLEQVNISAWQYKQYHLALTHIHTRVQRRRRCRNWHMVKTASAGTRAASTLNVASLSLPSTPSAHVYYHVLHSSSAYCRYCASDSWGPVVSKLFRMICNFRTDALQSHRQTSPSPYQMWLFSNLFPSLYSFYHQPFKSICTSLAIWIPRYTFAPTETKTNQNGSDIASTVKLNGNQINHGT